MSDSEMQTQTKLTKRPWTAEEDEKLTECVEKYGAARWSMIAALLESGRVGKQCRERWNNHLSPDLKKDNWSVEEDRAILEGAATLGTRWCEIIKSPALTGRTDNSIKNRFYALQRRSKARQQAACGGFACHDIGEVPQNKQRREEILAIASSIATTTDEVERDALIGKLTVALHGSHILSGALEMCEDEGSGAEAGELEHEKEAHKSTLDEEEGVRGGVDILEGLLFDPADVCPGQEMSKNAVDLLEESETGLRIHLPSLCEQDAPASPASSLSEDSLLVPRSETSSRSSSPLMPGSLPLLSPTFRRLKSEKVSIRNDRAESRLKRCVLAPLAVPDSPASRTASVSSCQRSSSSWAEGSTDSPKRMRTPNGWSPGAIGEVGACDLLGTKESDEDHVAASTLLLPFGKRRSSFALSPLALPAQPPSAAWHTITPLSPSQQEATGTVSDFLPLNVFADLFARDVDVVF